jgi:hypothetical protein
MKASIARLSGTFLAEVFYDTPTLDVGMHGLIVFLGASLHLFD